MKVDTIIAEYTNGFMEVKQLVKLYPNDMDLGKAIRSLIVDTDEKLRQTITNIPSPPRSQVVK